MTLTPPPPNGPLPPELVARLLEIEDWRARGLALASLVAEHGGRGRRAAILRQVAHAAGQHRTGVDNLESITRWLRQHFPRGLDPEAPSYSLRGAIALRTLWLRDAKSAELVADQVFAGGLGPAGLRDAVALATGDDRTADAEETATSRSAHARLATAARRQALRHALDERFEGAEAEVVDRRGIDEMPEVACDLVYRPPTGAPIYVLLALLPAPASVWAAHEIMGRTMDMMRLGRAVVVIGASRHDLAIRLSALMQRNALEGVTILLARFDDCDHVTLQPLEG